MNTRNRLYTKLLSRHVQYKQDLRDLEATVEARWFKRYQEEVVKREENGREVWRLKAILERKLPPGIGIQEGLNELGKRREFTAILPEEAKACKASLVEATHGIQYLYEHVPEFSGGNDSVFGIRYEDYGLHERAELVAFLKMQIGNGSCFVNWDGALALFSPGTYTSFRHFFLSDKACLEVVKETGPADNAKILYRYII
ncbi:hypothetical protein C7212DRAFT_365994 [Tuber magnatum]|uniref:Uncharacterized protein n=1 Tax=Tuber magnatum TaxID=42249 RepID=A0A317SFF2_9PEZI|nr:hypothetical protein C7212DRAFT_365994 [Tuber magnatum]